MRRGLFRARLCLASKREILSLRPLYNMHFYSGAYNAQSAPSSEVTFATVALRIATQITSTTSM